MFGLCNENVSQQYLDEYVGSYGEVSREQLSRIMENAGFDSKKIDRYLNALKEYGVTNYDKKAKVYFASNYTEPSAKRAANMRKLQWVLIDFLGKVEHHFPISAVYTPSYICMMLEDRAYELVYCEKGMEKYLGNQLAAARAELLYRAESDFFNPIVEKDDKARLEATKYIILLDTLDNVALVQNKQVAYYCTLDEENRPEFFTPEDLG